MAGTRPATISELASFAQTDPDLASSSNRELGHYLRRAETHRKSGKALASTAGTGPNTSGDIGTDLERAFVEYARAATLIVEKIPGHGDYTGTLSAEQRANLTANGEDILHQLGRLKARLVERYERYARSPAASAEAVPAFMLPSTTRPPQRAQSISQSQSQSHQGQSHSQSRFQAATHASAEAHAQAQDEAARWRAQPQYTRRSSASSASGIYASAGPSSMPVPVSYANSTQPQPSALPPSFGRVNAGTSARDYSNLNPSGTGPRHPGPYPESAGVSFGGASGVSSASAYAASRGGASSAASTYATSSAAASNTSLGSYASSSSSSTPASSTSTYSASSSNYYNITSTPSYNTGAYDTPTPLPLPLRPTNASKYEYDGESMDSEGAGAGGWRGISTSRSVRWSASVSG